MPRFGIRAQFTLLSLGLMAIPLVGLNYWEEIQKTALTAQARIQEIEAKAIVTTLQATQQNIGELLAADETSDLEKPLSQRAFHQAANSTRRAVW